MSDGSIMFDTEVDDSDIKRSRGDILKAFEGILKSVKRTSDGASKSLSEMSSQQLHYTNELNKTNEKIDEYKAKIAALKSEQIPTKEYAELQEQLKEAEKLHEDLVNKKREYNEIGFKDSQLTTQIGNIQAVEVEIQKIKNSMFELQNSGNATTFSQKTVNEIQNMNQKLTDSKAKAEELKKKLEEIENKNQSPGFLESMKQQFSNIVNSANNLKSKIAGLFKKGAKQGNDFAKSFLRIGTMLKGRILRSVVTAIVNGIKNGFQNLAQYSKSFNQSISNLKSSFTQLGNTVMTAVAPIIQALVPIIQSVIDKVIEAINVVAQFTARLFGNATTFTKAKKVNEDYAKSLGKTAKSQKQLLSFDTVEKLSNNSNSSNGGTDPSQMFETVNIDENISSLADRLKQAVQNGDWEGIGKEIATRLNSAIGNINLGELGTKLGTKITNALHAVHGFLSNFNFRAVGSTLAEGINGLSNSIDWGLLASDISLGITGVFNTFSTFIQTLDWQMFGRNIHDFLTNIDWGAIVSSMAEGLGSAIGGFFGLVWGFFTKVGEDIANFWWNCFQEAGGNAWEGFLLGIYKGLYAIGEFLVEKVWKPFKEGFCKAFGIHSPSTKMAEFGGFIVEGLKQGITNAWNGLMDGVKNLCSNFVNGVKNFFGIHSPSTVFADMGENITAGLENGIGDGNGAFDGLTVLSADTVEDIKSAWSGIGTWFLENVTTPLEKTFDSFSKTFEGIMDGTTSIVKATLIKSVNYMNIMIDSLQTYLNQVVKAVNSIIREINSMSSETGVSLPYVSSARLQNIPLPKLRTGTVVPANFGEFAAILGDNKREPEIISPYSTMKQAFIDAMNETGGQDVNVNFTGTLAQFIRMLDPEIKRQNRRVGSSMRKATGGAY